MKITALSNVREAKPYPSGSILRAFFGVEFRGIALHDCMLIENQDGTFFIMPPKAMNSRGEQRSVVQIFEPGLKAKIRDAVLDARDALDEVGAEDEFED
mgnify:CR=1 FL=1